MEIYKEHGMVVSLISVKRVGDNFKGVREGKPFAKNGKLLINKSDGLYEVSEYEIKNHKGGIISLQQSSIDTEVCVRCIYISRDIETVVIERTKDGQHFHIFPGGHQMISESEVEAVKRELQEEVGGL